MLEYVGRMDKVGLAWIGLEYAGKGLNMQNRLEYGGKA